MFLAEGCDIVIVNRRGNENAVRAFRPPCSVSARGSAITFVRVTERKIHFADVQPGAVDFSLF